MAGLMFDRPFTPSELRSLLQGNPVSPSQLQSGAAPANFSQAPTRGLVDYDALRDLRSAPKPQVSTTTTAIPKQPIGVGTQLVDGLTKIVTSPVGKAAGGIGMMLYPSSLGDGTLDSPEAKQAMAANNANQVVGFEGDVPIIQGPQGQAYNNKEIIQKQIETVKVPNPISVTPNNLAPVVAAPIVPTSVGIPDYDLSRNTSPDRIDPSAERRGQQNAFEQPLFEEGYQPTNFNGVLYKTDDFGQTNYQHPKGSMTFQGGAIDFPSRQGGGTLSVLGGRSKEEQAGIDQRVAEINSQTDALRALKGKPSLAEEARMQRIQSVMDQMMPNIDTTYLNDQQRAALEFQQNQLRTGLTQQLMELEDAKQKNSSANEFAALKFAAERGDAQAKQQLNQYKAYLDALGRGQGHAIDAARVKIDQGRLDQDRRNAIDKRIESYIGRDENDQPILIPKVFEDKRHVQPLGDGKNARPGLVYKLPNGMYGMVDPKTGELMENMTIVDVESVLN